MFMVKLVGILNITPDSFSDGGLYLDPAAIIERANQLFSDGAAIIDIGAESTRPNAIPLTAEAEWKRLEPVIKALIIKYPGKISLDSYRPATIRRALTEGPIIVNDVTGLNNAKMMSLVKELKPTVIVSHLDGIDIQKAHIAIPTKDANSVKEQLLQKASELLKSGFSKDQIILDPGIGFGKTMELNKKLLTFAELVPGFNVMIGYSRKRFLGENRMELEPNLKAGKVAAAHGAAYLRVHDVKGHQSLLG